MPHSRILTAALASAAALSLFGTASAGCNHSCAATGHSGVHAGHTLPPLSSWRGSSSQSSMSHHGTVSTTMRRMSAPVTYSSGSASSSYSYSSGVGGAYPDNCPTGTSPQADGTCLDVKGTYRSTSYASGISSRSYNTGGLTFTPFTSSQTSGSGYTLPSLKPGESLQPTACPVNVYNPDGGKVMGCYNIVKSTPKPRARHMHYVRPVMRPVVYVRYRVVPVIPVQFYAPVMAVPVCRYRC